MNPSEYAERIADALETLTGEQTPANSSLAGQLERISASLEIWVGAGGILPGGGESYFYTLEQFGGDGTGGVANDQAWAEMIGQIETDDRNRNGWIYRGAKPVLLIGPEYGFDAAIDIKNTLRIRGFGVGQAGGNATRIVFPSDSGGFRIQRYNTTGLNGPGAETTGGDGTIIEGLHLVGTATAPDIQKPGILMRARGIVRDCYISGFAGSGVAVIADVNEAGANHGNANNWEVSNCRIQGNGYSGIYAAGGDANAGRTYGNDCTGNYRYGIEDRAFLGNSHRDNHSDANGIHAGTGFDQTSVVSDGTWRYRLIDGQDANAASTAPTTGASNSVWQLIGAGDHASWAGIPLYSGYTGDFVSGGSYYIAGGNAYSEFSGNYEEGGNAPAVINSPSVGIGGFTASGTNPHIFSDEQMPASGRGWRQKVAFPNSATIINTYGGRQATGVSSIGNNASDIFASQHSVYSPSGWSFGYGVAGWFRPADIWLQYGGDTAVPFGVTGPSTTEQFGTGGSKPYYLNAINFALGPADGSARIMTYGSEAPTTGAHARGEIVFNNGVTGANDAVDYWRCTAAGTPGTWVARP